MPNVLEQLDYCRHLWTKAMPNVPPPEGDHIISWIGEFSDKVVTYGILRAQRKLRTKTALEPGEHYRYAGGVIFHEQKLPEAKMQQAGVIRQRKNRRQHKVLNPAAPFVIRTAAPMNTAEKRRTHEGWICPACGKVRRSVREDKEN